MIVGRKPVGSLVLDLDDLRPGRHLYMLSTGTGLAPFISIIQDSETYERFDKVILMHGVRQVSELAYAKFIEEELPANEFIGDLVRDKLIYYPTVTREPFRNHGRLTDVIASGKLFRDIGLPPIDAAFDRAMICGSAAMLADSCRLLNGLGFHISPRQGALGGLPDRTRVRRTLTQASSHPDVILFTSEARWEISMKLPSGSRTNDTTATSPILRTGSPSMPPRSSMAWCSAWQSRTCTVR